MSNNAKMIGSGRQETVKFVRDNQEPEDFYNFWEITEADAETAKEIAPAEKFVYRPTWADWRTIILSSATKVKNSPLLLSVSAFLVGCLVGVVLGYHAKP